MQGLQRELSPCKHFISDFQYFRKITLQNKLQLLWIHYSPNTNVSLEKYLMHNIAHNRVQKWKKVVDKRKVFGIFLTVLLKVFNCLSNNLLIVKLIVKLNA